VHGWSLLLTDTRRCNDNWSKPSLKLLERNVSVDFVRLRRNWYTRLTASVLWNNSVCAHFVVLCGVRQGGVLPPPPPVVVCVDWRPDTTFKAFWLRYVHRKSVCWDYSVCWWYNVVVWIMWRFAEKCCFVCCGDINITEISLVPTKISLIEVGVSFARMLKRQNF